VAIPRISFADRVNSGVPTGTQSEVDASLINQIKSVVNSLSGFMAAMGIDPEEDYPLVDSVANLADLNTSSPFAIVSGAGWYRLYHKNPDVNNTYPGYGVMHIESTVFTGGWSVQNPSGVVTPFDFGAEIGSDATTAIQLALNFIGEYRLRLYIPDLPGNADFEITYALVPHKQWCYVYGDGGIMNVNPSHSIITRGCVFLCGNITYPLLSRIESIGQDGVEYSVIEDGQTPKYMHNLSSIILGQRKITIDDVGLYSLVSVGELVSLRSDDLGVDKTGTTAVTRNRRYGVYTYQSLFKIVDKWEETISGITSRYIMFEHPVDYDIENPILTRFPKGDETIYSDTSPDPLTGLSNKLPVGPIENFFLYGIRMGTSGNQCWSQANCVYNFKIFDVHLNECVGAVVGNHFCHGFMGNWSGSVLGPVFAVAFGAKNVTASNFNIDVVGPSDERNPNVSVVISGSSIAHRNDGYGAINDLGVFDPNYKAIVYVRNNRNSAVFFNYESQRWEYWERATAIYSDLANFSEMPQDATRVSFGYGSYQYIPDGSTVSGVTISGAVKEARSIINIHEACRNIKFLDSVITIEKDLDLITQDANLVGDDILVSGVTILSTRESSLGDVSGVGTSFGGFINKGDLPLPSKNITVSNCYFSGSPVSSGIVVDEFYNYPSKDNSRIVLEGEMAGTYFRLLGNYTLSGSDLTSLVVERNDADTSFLNRRYACYYDSFRKKLLAFCPEGFGPYVDGVPQNPKGWYIVPFGSALPVDPNTNEFIVPSVGSDFTQFDSSLLTTVVNDTSTGVNWTALESTTNLKVDTLVFLGESSGYVYYGPSGYFSDGDGSKIYFVPESLNPSGTDFKAINVTIDRAVAYGVSVRGGHYCTFKDIFLNRFVREEVPESVKAKYIAEVKTVNSNFSTNNVFDTIRVLDSSSFATIYPYRDQGIGNIFTNVHDDRSFRWDNFHNVYVRQTTVPESGETQETATSFTAYTLRSVLDFNPQADGGIVQPKLEGLFKSESDAKLDQVFDRMVFDSSYTRVGYEMRLFISGKTLSGAPSIRFMFGNPNNLTPLGVYTLSPGPFYFDVSMIVADRLNDNEFNQGSSSNLATSENRIISVVRGNTGAASVDDTDIQIARTAGGVNFITVLFDLEASGISNDEAHVLYYKREPKTIYRN